MLKMSSACLCKSKKNVCSRDVSKLSLFILLAGGSSRSALRSAGVPGGGSSRRLATAATPAAGPAETAHRGLWLSSPRCAAVDRQLRTPLRLHLRIPPFLRPPPLRIIRPLRPTEEADVNLGVPGQCHGSAGGPHSALLHHPCLRL